jgi:hypothetical protein
MQGQQWINFLLNEMGQSYRKEGGLIVAKSDPKKLKHSYEGWQDILIAWDRDLSKFGVNRNFSLSLGFVLDGLEILRDLFYTKNFEEKIYLLIQKQILEYTPGVDYCFKYKYFYKGELDLSTAIVEENKININITEGKLHKDLKANEATDYEIPVDEINVMMDGVELKQSANYLVTNGALPNNLAGHSLNLNLVGQEAITTIGATTEIRKVHENSPSDLWDSNNYFLITSTVPTTITIDFDFEVFLELASGIGPVPTTYILQLQVLEDSSNRQTFILFQKSGTAIQLYNQWHHFVGSYTTTIPANRRCVLYMTAIHNRDFTYYRYNNNNGSMNIKYNYQHAVSFIKANHLHTTFKRIVGRLSNSEDNAVSELLNNDRAVVVTSGDAIRGLPNSKMVTSFNDMFDSINTIKGIGVGIENEKIVLESKLHFVNPVNVIPLGIVKDVKTKIINELICNTVKIGFPNQTYNDVNGRNEFNTTHLYTSQVKRIVRELNLVSVWRGDCYGIEFTRINLDGKTTTDSKSDNDCFFLCIDYANPQTLTEETNGLPAGTVYYKLFRETYTSITGVISPLTIFNIPITPRRCMYKHESYFNSIFYGFESTGLKFERNDKNDELHTIKPGEDIQEKADFRVSTGSLFKPIGFEFKPESSTNLVELLQDNPNRYFSFIHTNGKTYFGFNLKVGIAPNSLEEQAFVLLSGAINDLTTLK